MLDVQRIAHHEAGHAVIGRALHLHCGGVSIAPDTYPGAADVGADWDGTGRRRTGRRMAFREDSMPLTQSARSLDHARIIALMAGKEAADLCCGPREGGNYGDELVIDSVARDCGEEDRLPRLRVATRALCIRHRGRIERVASALLERHTLSAEEIGAMCGRSSAPP